jgi:hypothetical protein
MFAIMVCHRCFFQKASKSEMENGASKVLLIYCMSTLSDAWSLYLIGCNLIKANRLVKKTRRILERERLLKIARDANGRYILEETPL